MLIHNRLRKIRSLLDDNVVTVWEFVDAILAAILSGEISTVGKIKDLITSDLSEDLGWKIQAIEANGYVHPNPYGSVEISDEELKQRTPVYRTVFAELKSHLADLEAGMADP